MRLVSELVMSCPPRSTRVTASDNAITNGLDVFRERGGATRVMASNNDNMLRVFDAATLKCIRCVQPQQQLQRSDRLAAGGHACWWARWVCSVPV